LQPTIFEIACSGLNIGVTFKSGLWVIQSHWKWHPSTDRMRLPIGIL